MKIKSQILSVGRVLFYILCALILIGKVSNWFFNYPDHINDLINTVMFCLIGLSYFAYAWALDKKWQKLMVFVCGIFLITMNFIPREGWVWAIGIACILAPMILAKVLPVEDEEEHEKELSTE